MPVFCGPLSIALLIPIAGFLLTTSVSSQESGKGTGAFQSREKGQPRNAFALARQRGSLKSIYREKRTQATTQPDGKSGQDTFRKEIQPLLAGACFQCHGKSKEEAGLRIDRLNPDLSNGQDVAWWLEVLAVINNSEMPPDEDNQLSEQGRAKIVQWLSRELKTASEARKNRIAKTSFRRMTRYELNYALQDLLGISHDFTRDLPVEVMESGGFKNSSHSLELSVSQLESIRRVAGQALKRTIVSGERPQPLYWGLTMDQVARLDWQKQEEQLSKSAEKHKDNPQQQKMARDKLLEKFRAPPNRPSFHSLTTGRYVQASWAYYNAKYCNRPGGEPPAIPEKTGCVAILPQGRNQKLTIELGDRLPDEGTMKVRVRAARVSNNERDRPSLRLEFGWQASNEGRSVVKVGRPITPIDSQEYRFYQWEIPLGDIYPRNSVRGRYELGATPSPSEYIKVVNDSISEGAIKVDYVEVVAPFHREWPPAPHLAILPDSTPAEKELQVVRDILDRFMLRAWRRPVSTNEINRKITLFKRVRPLCSNFEEAVRETLATVIASPNFLFVGSGENPAGGSNSKSPANLGGYRLASRLSFFLWCSLPDEALLQVAEDGSIFDKATLSAQVSRMLASPKAGRFSRHFVNQWLNLDRLKLVNFRKTYPAFDPELKTALLEEPVRLFEEILESNRSLLDLVHSDYLLVNARLATHYGVANVRGNHFRKVDLPAGLHRGGLLAAAGILTMNSDGKDSHPLKRGVWMLEKILHDPPPPPPPAVPEIDLSDPNIAKMTLKERIESHRDHAACMSCHVKIDPWGIALENFDAIGRYRTQLEGKPVDATSVLVRNEKLEGIDGLKMHLLEKRQDQVVRGLVENLASFAIGRPLTFEDHWELEKITTLVRKRGDRLEETLRTIVESDLFSTR
ncbi:MAG: DUF1592 domain-containing protein [Planctomycetota bacterium]|nr:DUF1592 domain-containing protein [Planctomycetota bacterium]